jgi:hypothetical protein
VAGATGLTGVTGLVGATGLTGQTGIQGATGVLGTTGLEGKGWTVIYGSTGTLKNAYLGLYSPSNSSTMILPRSGRVLAIGVDSENNTTADFTVAIRLKGSSTDILTLYKPTGTEFAYAAYDQTHVAGTRYTCYVYQGTEGNGQAVKPDVSVYGVFD